MKENASQHWLDVLRKYHDDSDKAFERNPEETFHQYNGGVTTSFFFKIKNADEFIKDKLQAYVLETKDDDRFGIKRFLIDKTKLDGISLSESGLETFGNLKQRFPESYCEELEIDVFKNGYVAIIDTLYIIVPQNMSHVTDGMWASKESVAGEIFLENEPVEVAYNLIKPLRGQSRPKLEVVSELRSEFRNVKSGSNEYLDLMCVPKIYDAKYYNACVCANTYVARLIDIIINQALESSGDYSKVTFIFPDGVDFIEKEFKAGGWGPYNLFGKNDDGASINFILYSNNEPIEEEAKIEIVNYIETALTNKIIRPFINDHLRENYGNIFTYSLNNGQSVVLFDDRILYSEVDYEKYLYSFLTRVVNKIECIFEGKRYQNLLENSPIVKYKDHPAKMKWHKTVEFIKNLSPRYKNIKGTQPEELEYSLNILKNDIEQSSISFDENSVAKIWLKKTNTLELIEHVKALCVYFSNVNGIGRDNKKEQLLNLIGVLTIISAVWDFWNMMFHDKPLGKIVSAIVACITLLMAYIFWPRN